MVDPLIVDPARLAVAGDTLRSLTLPAAPAPVSAPGSDAMAAAINATMPLIEAPVVDGLPAAQAALRTTGAKVVSAATTYADADRSLGSQLAEQRFTAADTPQRAAVRSPGSPVRDAVAAPTIAAAAGAQESTVAAAAGAQGSTVAAAAGAQGSTVAAAAGASQSGAPLSQFATAAGSAASGAQGVMQSVQGVVGGMSTAGAGAPATPAPQRESPESFDDAVNGEAPDGAAPGEQAGEGAPLPRGASAPAAQSTPEPVASALGSGRVE